jgi:hypothetical protein
MRENPALYVPDVDVAASKFKVKEIKIVLVES